MKQRTAWDLRNIYLYLVCFVCIIMILVGTVTALNNFIDLFFPEYYSIGPEMIARDYQDYIKYNQGTNNTMSLEEYQKMREEQQQLDLQRQKSYKKKQMAQSFSMIIVAVPFYLYHWRKIEREKAE